MKTLKQLLEETKIAPFNKNDCFSRDEQDTILTAIKEWLTQKRQEAYWLKWAVYDELLEELNK